MQFMSLIFLSLCFAVYLRAESTLQDETTRLMSSNENELNTQDDTNPCPKGFILYKNDCFYVSEEEKTWNEAKLECENLYSNLLVPSSKVIIDFSMNFFEQFELDGRYMVNLKDKFGKRFFNLV